jgi:hypothetical protein
MISSIFPALRGLPDLRTTKTNFDVDFPTRDNTRLDPITRAVELSRATVRRNPAVQAESSYLA